MSVSSNRTPECRSYCRHLQVEPSFKQDHRKGNRGKKRPYNTIFSRGYKSKERADEEPNPYEDEDVGDSCEGKYPVEHVPEKNQNPQEQDNNCDIHSLIIHRYLFLKC